MMNKNKASNFITVKFLFDILNLYIKVQLCTVLKSLEHFFVAATHESNFAKVLKLIFSEFSPA